MSSSDTCRFIAPTMQTAWPPPSPHATPPWAPPTAGAFYPGKPAHPTFPLHVAVGAVVTLGASLLVGRSVLRALIHLDWPIAVYIALSAVLSYGPVLAWCVLATRRVSGDPWRQRLGLSFLRVDFGWAPVTWLATFGVQIVVGLIVVGTRIPFESNTDGLDGSSNRTYLLSLLVLAVVAAPIVEEIAFRAVVLRGLLSRFSPVAAIGIQAVLFGLAHADPVRGLGNIGLVIITGAIGASFGAAAYWFRRIGITIAVHAMVNGLALALVLSGVLDNAGS
jgi:membrane protease YdiL (CAAX protease family)